MMTDKQMIWKSPDNEGRKHLYIKVDGFNHWHKVPGNTAQQYRKMQQLLLEGYELLKSPPTDS